MMIEIRRRALVRYTPQQMFDLVNDVEAYPRRFAWCTGAQVLERDDAHVVARLDLRFAGVVQHFTTRNALDPPARIAMQFVDGPFRHLHGAWTFAALGEHGCKVALALDFEHSGKFASAALRIGFQKLADHMVDDFVAEAKRTYG